MDSNLPRDPDQDPDVAMVDATGDGTPHGGQDLDSHPGQELPSNPEAPGPGDQEGQQPEKPANLNVIQGDVPPKIIKRQECKHLLKRIGFSIDVAQTIV